MNKEKWIMPKWMEPYRKYILNTGGNSVESLVNDHGTSIFENAYRAVMCVCVKDQVALLCNLHKDGLLGKDIFDEHIDKIAEVTPDTADALRKVRDKYR